MSKKPAHIGEVPAGSPVGTRTKRLCDGKKTKTKSLHWDRPVCPACVNAFALITSNERAGARWSPVWTWTLSTSAQTWTSSGGDVA